MAEEDTLNLKPGSHSHSIARLEVGQTHALAFDVGQEFSEDTEVPEVISQRRSRMAHSATSIIGRVREKLPERTFSVSTGVLAVSDNTVYTVAVIKRTT